ncbi:MAG: hypothetical protein M3Y67_07865, partial [Pseudomonadota bacterium]|nr:hypothetical protein [Pseudomonadota bacterium]
MDKSLNVPLSAEAKRSAAAERRKLRWRMAANRLLLVVLILVVWSVAANGMPAFVLPGPQRVWNAWLKLVG